MLNHIKIIEEISNVDYVNEHLKKGWILLKIIDTGKGLLYVIGFPNYIR